MGFPRKRKTRGCSTKDVEAGMYNRLQLGRTTTNFFSETGNKRLKRIWLENGLDKEMIFSSWLGPSKVLFRQKVSDYLQAFLLRRSKYVGTLCGEDLLSLLRRFSVHCDLTVTDGKAKQEYFNDYVQTSLKKRCEKREREERLRLERSIANEELPVLPGFEYVSQHPIFRVGQLEKRMKYLSKIPLPYDDDVFDKHILPILTSLAIAEEKTEGRFGSKKILQKQCQKPRSQKPTSESGDDSGVTSAQNSFSTEAMCSSNSSTNSVSDLLQNFSEMELKEESLQQGLDETINDICEVCGGLCDYDSINESTCTCLCDKGIWTGKNVMTASSLFSSASKIVDLHTVKHKYCKSYIDKFNCNKWTNSISNLKPPSVCLVNLQNESPCLEESLKTH